MLAQPEFEMDDFDLDVVEPQANVRSDEDILESMYDEFSPLVTIA